MWTPDNEKEFVAVKKLLTLAPIARDPQLESKLLTDASRSRIGFALIQEGPDGQKRLITCGLCGLNSAEARYTPVELECLGVVYTSQKCAFYIMGPPKLFTVVTDHLLLLGVFNKPISEIPNSRLQRLRLKVVGANMRLPGRMGSTISSRTPCPGRQCLRRLCWTPGNNRRKLFSFGLWRKGMCKPLRVSTWTPRRKTTTRSCWWPIWGGRRCGTSRRTTQPIAAGVRAGPTTASRPMQAVGLDFFHAGGCDYLVMVD